MKRIVIIGYSTEALTLVDATMLGRHLLATRPEIDGFVFKVLTLDESYVSELMEALSGEG